MVETGGGGDGRGLWEVDMVEDWGGGDGRGLGEVEMVEDWRRWRW